MARADKREYVASDDFWAKADALWEQAHGEPPPRPSRLVIEEELASARQTVRRRQAARVLALAAVTIALVLLLSTLRPTDEPERLHVALTFHELSSIRSASTNTGGGYAPGREPLSVTDEIESPVFNTISDNPSYGDERTFYDVVRFPRAEGEGFENHLRVEPGDRVLVRMYLHQNATSGAAAVGTRVRALIPDGRYKELRSIGYISADNATPGQVSDAAGFSSDVPVTLKYVVGSATIYTNESPSGRSVSDALVTEGTAIGDDVNDGVMPAGVSAYLTFLLDVN